MYKVPIRHKRSISQELKKFVPLVNSLQARGKAATEEDTRILLNDIFHYVLGYDKYHELKTELREKGGRIDYVVKLSDGPLKNKSDRFDFVVEAKASSVDLGQAVIDQTLKYCLTTNTDYFIVTNSVKWQLHKVKSGKNAAATLVHEVIRSFALLPVSYQLFIISKSQKKRSRTSLRIRLLRLKLVILMPR